MHSYTFTICTAVDMYTNHAYTQINVIELLYNYITYIAMYIYTFIITVVAFEKVLMINILNFGIFLK